MQTVKVIDLTADDDDDDDDDDDIQQQQQPVAGPSNSSYTHPQPHSIAQHDQDADDDDDIIIVDSEVEVEPQQQHAKSKTSTSIHHSPPTKPNEQQQPCPPNSSNSTRPQFNSALSPLPTQEQPLATPSAPHSEPPRSQTLTPISAAASAQPPLPPTQSQQQHPLLQLPPKSSNADLETSSRSSQSPSSSSLPREPQQHLHDDDAEDSDPLLLKAIPVRDLKRKVQSERDNSSAPPKKSKWKGKARARAIVQDSEDDDNEEQEQNRGRRTVNERASSSSSSSTHPTVGGRSRPVVLLPKWTPSQVLPTAPSPSQDKKSSSSKRARSANHGGHSSRDSSLAPSRSLLTVKEKIIRKERVQNADRKWMFDEGLLVPGDNDGPDSDKTVKAYVDSQSRELPWRRLLQGPTFDNEFRTYYQYLSLKTETPFSPNSSFTTTTPTKFLQSTETANATQVFQTVLDTVHALEQPLSHRVRLCPSPDPSCPRAPVLDFTYTNRVIYPAGVVPVEGGAGCRCSGSCDLPGNGERCECRMRQEAIVRTRRGGEGRGEKKGFAYGSDKSLRWEGVRLEPGFGVDPIIECSDRCGCGPGCVNMASSTAPNHVKLDIFWTGKTGWGIRCRPLSDGGTLIPAMTPIGVYAGEMLKHVDVDDRFPEDGELVLNYFWVRSPIASHHFSRPRFYIDSFHIREEFVDHRYPIDEDASAKPGKKKGKARSSAKHRVGKFIAGPNIPLKGRARNSSNRPQFREDSDEDGEEVDEFRKFYWTVDAHRYGNFTRYFNHSCNSNVMTLVVYRDDNLLTRPLQVFFSTRDIQPGEEITVSYSNEEAALEPGQTLQEYCEKAQSRRVHDPVNQCHCGYELCRGTMFKERK
ncbi:SET domain-containing protein [Meredithblackwellia eburnea MCA 4105]